MAARKSTARGRPRRIRRPSIPAARPDPRSGTLEQTIEQERTRLARALAILRCLRTEILYADARSDVLALADVVDVAREFVDASVQQLDSVHISRLTARVAPRSTCD